MNESTTVIEQIQNQLFGLQDKKFREFNAKLIPNIQKEKVIGVRVPLLRKMAASLENETEKKIFLECLPHQYNEENMLHSLILSRFKDYDELIVELDKFLPFVDNWCVCDILSPKIFKKYSTQLILKIPEWLESNHTYAIRFGIEMLMSFFLDDKFDEKYLSMVASVSSEEFYVRMMQAWYFATALAKQYASAVVFLEQKKLNTWTHNKTIQKAVESYRITETQKNYLRTLRIKSKV